MRFSFAASVLVASIVAAQDNELDQTITLSESGSAVATTTIVYSNPNTKYLTMTDSNGVVTGMPSAIVADDISMPAAAIVPAGLPAGVTSIPLNISSSITFVQVSIGESTTVIATAAAQSTSDSDSDSDSSDSSSTSDGDSTSTDSSDSEPSTDAAANNAVAASAGLLGLGALVAALL